jgi:tryptophan synthase alpha chain
MNRITAKFEELKAQGRKGLIGYLAAGDPDPAGSVQSVRTAIEHGVDLLELGVPFSDPTADGPTIQEATQRALAAGMTLAGTLGMVRELRRDVEIPIVLFGYANPFFRRGYERVCAEAAEAGVDGVLVVDLPFEESAELRTFAERAGLFQIPLIAPTTPGPRAAKILERAAGFVYYIMVRGVTGARTTVASDIAEHVGRLRACTALPIAVGFGVSNGQQARCVAESADAVVVGSALVRAARSGTLAQLVRELREALGE